MTKLQKSQHCSLGYWVPDLSVWQFLGLFVLPFVVGAGLQLLWVRRRVRKRFEERVAAHVEQEIRQRISNDLLQQLSGQQAADKKPNTEKETASL